MDPAGADGLGAKPPVESKADYFRRWSQLHGGVEPGSSRLIGGWLSASYALARPLTRVGFTPNSVTMLGLLVAIAAPLFAWLGIERAQPGFIWTAVVCIAVVGILDTLDGAVAVLSGRTTRWGYVLDSVTDRISDCAMFAVLFVLGAPAWMCGLAAMFTVVQEYARARAAAAGMSEVGVVSIWERPTRLILAAVFTGLAAWGIYSRDAGQWATYGAIAALALSLVGLAQVLVSIRRKLL